MNPPDDQEHNAPRPVNNRLFNPPRPAAPVNAAQQPAAVQQPEAAQQAAPVNANAAQQQPNSRPAMRPRRLIPEASTSGTPTDGRLANLTARLANLPLSNKKKTRKRSAEPLSNNKKKTRKRSAETQLPRKSKRQPKAPQNYTPSH